MQTVYLVFLVMLVCTCLNAADIYYWFGAGFGDITRFSKAGFSPFYTPLMGSVIALVVQLFFCYRISVFRTGSARAVWWSVAIASVSPHHPSLLITLGIFRTVDHRTHPTCKFLAFIPGSLWPASRQPRRLPISLGSLSNITRRKRTRIVVVERRLIAKNRKGNRQSS